MRKRTDWRTRQRVPESDVEMVAREDIYQTRMEDVWMAQIGIFACC